ncbi:hypothetical protein T11_11736 [Trichinella zimbabwensis]|uniref:Uncharacterized protein n=1 Tax=Trichinella zimbabwensis TaxID=268475 RepID=A0A0V1HBT8_9BILA|nr:hypothetical protein T11_11736 [Trichinella zimbabwensis]
MNNDHHSSSTEHHLKLSLIDNLTINQLISNVLQVVHSWNIYVFLKKHHKDVILEKDGCCDGTLDLIIIILQQQHRSEIVDK